uniref:Uncharacterized protein n=1 Tax=Anguilla anguilla TaxID=7936 RepID=A0A0E9VS87_ANGAN
MINSYRALLQATLMRTLFGIGQGTWNVWANQRIVV